MKTWQEIKSERDHACDVARNAANCLGSLYNILGNIDENGVEHTKARMAECLTVLDGEIANMQRDKREVVEAIHARLAELTH